MEREELIKEYQANGFNCAQVVAVAFADKVNQKKITMLAAASGFGGGIGRQAKTCGALTGAAIVLGFNRGQTENLDLNAKELTYNSVQQLFSQFANINGATDCKDLLQCDISTAEGLEIHSTGIHKEKCLGCIRSSMAILDKILDRD